MPEGRSPISSARVSTGDIARHSFAIVRRGFDIDEVKTYLQTVARSIEVLEQRNDMRFISVLAQRARSAQSRERANAIKALHRLKVMTVPQPLLMMLRDPRSEHRISAMWTLRQIGWWQLLGEVGQLARSDADLRVRRYALGLLRGIADMAQAAKVAKKAG